MQYKFYKELEFAPVRSAAPLFGLLVHQTIEDIHKTVLRNEEHKITDKNIENWFNRNYNSLSKRFKTFIHEGVQKAALKQVLNYKNLHHDQWDKIKDTEVDVSLAKDEYILRGKIDLIKGENDTVEIIDFKTEKLKPDVNSDEDKMKLKRYQRQLEIYAHIVEERTQNKVSKMHLYYTGEETGNPYITYDRNKINLDNTIKEVDNVIALIGKKNYDMQNIKTTERMCKNCDIKFYCNKL